MPIISLRNVEKSYKTGAGETFVLRRISLDIEMGEFISVMGPSGAGKSTLIKVISGVHHPDGGTIRMNGEVVRFNSPHDAQDAGIATMYQELSLYPELTVAENIFMGHMPGGRLIDRAAMQERTAALLRRIDADFTADMPLKRLSVVEK